MRVLRKRKLLLHNSILKPQKLTPSCFTIFQGRRGRVSFRCSINQSAVSLRAENVYLMYGNIYCTHVASRGVGAGGYSGFQVTGMIELGKKSKRKILRTFNNTPKNPSTKINPQQQPMGHRLLTPKHPMQNFRALKLIKH